MLHHGISRLHTDARAPIRLIQRFVFPDGELSRSATCSPSLQRAGLEARDVESLREHYGLTLRRWLANLEAHRDAAVAEVGAERERVWRLYMLGSALGFEAGDVTVYQTLTTRAGAPHGLPLRREGAVVRTAAGAGRTHGRMATPSTAGASNGRVPLVAGASPPDGDDKMTVQAATTHRTSSSLPHAYLLPVVRELPSLPSTALTTQTW